MWFIFCNICVLILLANISAGINVKVDADNDYSKNEEIPQIFDNVQNNNEDLEELINSNEYLKVDTAGFKNTDTKQFSKTDNVFRETGTESSNKILRNGTTLAIGVQKHYLVTKMFTSEEIDDSNKDNNSKEKHDRVSDTDRSHMSKSNENQQIIDIFLNDEPASKEYEVKLEVNKVKPFTKRDHKHSYEVKIPDEVFNKVSDDKRSTKKTNKISIVRMSLKEHESDTVFDNNIKQKNKLKNVTTETTIINFDFTTTTKSIKDNAKYVKHVIRSEDFNEENIWKDIADGAPIRLRAVDMKYYSDRHTEEEHQEDFSRSRKRRSISEVDSNTTKKQDDSISLSDTSGLSEDEKTIKEEITKTHMLREAYGDACLKVVVKKCYKACKSAGKVVCRSIKCRGDHKETFQRYSRTGCVNQFSSPENSTRKKNNNVQPFINARRIGFENCYPFIKFPAPRTNTTLPNPTEIKLNILRDSYERACSKASAQRCKEACKYAYTKTCAEHTCTKSHKKLYSKTCKRLCKNAYRYEKKTSKTSKSGSTESGSSSSSSGTDR